MGGITPVKFRSVSGQIQICSGVEEYENDRRRVDLR